MNPFLPVLPLMPAPRRLPNQLRSATIPRTCGKIRPRRLQVQRHRLRLTGTVNFAGRNWRARLLPLLPAMLVKLPKKLSRKKRNGFQLDPSIAAVSAMLVLISVAALVSSLST